MGYRLDSAFHALVSSADVTAGQMMVIRQIRGSGSQPG